MTPTLDLSPVALPLALVALAACAGSRPPPQAPAERILTVEGGSGRLRVSDGGTGEPAVVFLHGLGSDLEAWRAQLDHLRPGRRAVAYDQRGHGGSDPARDGVYTIQALAADLGAVIQALGIHRLVLVGHSLSGTVVTEWAGAHPEAVAGLVYADAVGDFHAVPREAIEEQVRKDEAFGPDPAARQRAFSEMLGAAARPGTRERILASVARMDGAAFAPLRRDMFEFRVGDRLAGYRGPVLAVEAQGAEHPIMASRVVPGASRTTIAGVSHWLMMDDPEAFDRALEPLLAGAAARPRGSP
ncbi:MAG TPA: alpha/beta hydrolase [Anaeromyxobacteraceae bacterium]|nr:alpha/beta hydrolase [Anaeromyxobacteraceae bacterium]